MTLFTIFSPPTEPVDFTVVDDSTLQQVKTSSDGLPVDVNVNFEVLGNTVSLNLKRNPKVATPKDSVYVIRNSEAGIPVLVSQLVQEKEVCSKMLITNWRSTVYKHVVLILYIIVFTLFSVFPQNNVAVIYESCRDGFIYKKVL